MTDSKLTGLGSPAFAALGLAFASFGDAFLYPFLPVNFNAVGIPAVWVGVLLSVNRFVRIISNTLVVNVFAKYGLRSVMVLAVVLAILSTSGYAFANGVAAWLIFRAVWGLSFSVMRIGTLGYALQHERKGFALGLSRSLQEAGPMLALLLAPYLLTHFDTKQVFLVLALLSIPGLYFVLALPIVKEKTLPLQAGKIIQWPTTLNSITLISAIVVDGIVVVVLGVLFLRYRDSVTLMEATTLAAFYLGYRRICLVVLSPAGGWIADRVGLDAVFNVSMVMVTAGLIVVLSGWIGTGAVIVFTFYGVNSAVTPGSASKGNANPLAAVAANATWRDIGAAIGTLAGGFLISSRHLNTVLIIAIFVLVFLIFIHIGRPRNAIKQFYLWK